MITVLLADDHPVVLDGLARYLRRSGRFEVVACVADLTALSAGVAAHAPDVVVLDMDMPGMDGLPSITALRDAHAELGIVIFSMLEEDHYAANTLRAGAHAYLNKTRSPQELAEAIERAARDQRTITAEIEEVLLLAGSVPSGRVLHDALSGREREVFAGLVAGTPSRQIAEELRISQSTVHTYTERIKEKLGLGSVRELVAYAFRHGLVRR